MALDQQPRGRDSKRSELHYRRLTRSIRSTFSNQRNVYRSHNRYRLYMTMTKTFLIRCTPQELNIWKEQAWEERLSLNKWIRRRLHGVAPVVQLAVEVEALDPELNVRSPVGSGKTQSHERGAFGAQVAARWPARPPVAPQGQGGCSCTDGEPDENSDENLSEANDGAFYSAGVAFRVPAVAGR